MGKLTRIGIDTSKSVFQLHGVDDGEQPALKRKLRRQDLNKFFGNLPRLRIAMEACGASHHWARELQALGHEVALIPPQYTKPYVDRGKNDAADAEAICEAMSRPKVQRRFVPVKTLDQQALQMLMVVRNGLVKRRTQVSNAIRGHAAEFGLVSPKGLYRVEELLAKVEQSPKVPELAREMFKVLAGQYRHAEAQLREIEAKLMALHRGNEVSQRLAAIPSVGPVGAMAMAAKIGDANRFRSGRDFAAFIGLTPKDHSTAGRKRLGGITRAGDEMLRSHLVCGATAVIRQLKSGRGHNSPWLKDLVARKPEKLAAVALANKTARIAWKLMISGERYCTKYAEAA
jgi:transposase